MEHEPGDSPHDPAQLATDLRAAVARVKRRMREQASTGDLPPSQASVLLLLEKDGPATTSDLARTEGMRPQSMGAVIAALENAGFVEGSPDPQDGRRTLLSLTETCRTWMQEVRAARQDWLTGILQTRLSEEERHVLARAVLLLRRLVDE